MEVVINKETGEKYISCRDLGQYLHDQIKRSPGYEQQITLNTAKELLNLEIIKIKPKVMNMEAEK